MWTAVVISCALGAAPDATNLPPTVANVPVPLLMRDYSLVLPVYDRSAVCARLAMDGPATDEFRKTLDEAKAKGIAGKPDTDYRREPIVLLGPSKMALDVLKRRADSDPALREYLVSRHRYWLLDDDPEWLAKAMGDAAALRFVVEELRYWRANAGAPPERNQLAMLRMLGFASYLGPCKDKGLLELIESYADGSPGISRAVEAAAAMLLVEAGQRRDLYERVLGQCMADAALWSRKGDLFPTLFAHNAVLILRTRFDGVIAPATVMKAVGALPKQEAQYLLHVCWVKACAFEKSPAQNGARFIGRLRALQSPTQEREFVVGTDDREQILLALACLADRSNTAALRIVGEDWQQEVSPRLRFMRFMMMLYAGAPEPTKADYLTLVDILSPADRDRHGVSLDYGRAYFGDAQALRRMLDAMISAGGDRDPWMPSRSINRLITGTDYAAQTGSIAFFTWAAQNRESFVYNEAAHSWHRAIKRE